jgi:pyruvate,orthophosphate dikinase
MFFEPSGCRIIQKMIMADLPIERREALECPAAVPAGTLPGLFRAMDGLPVIIRLIDPPLHEFLPNHWI